MFNIIKILDLIQNQISKIDLHGILIRTLEYFKGQIQLVNSGVISKT